MASRRVTRLDQGVQLSTELPADVATGPDPEVWTGQYDVQRDALARLRWQRAGCAWSIERGRAAWSWLALLDPAVRHAVSALGRAEHVHAGTPYPWERP